MEVILIFLESWIYKFILTVTRGGITNCMKVKIMARKVARRWNIRVICNKHFEECFEWDFQVYSIYMSIFTTHIFSKSLMESLIKLLQSYSEYCDISCVFNYRSRHWDLCYNIVVLHVWSRILENTCQRKSPLLLVSWRPATSLKTNSFTGNIQIQ